MPFAVTTELAPSPWNPKTHLLRIGVKAWAPAPEALPPANLVFLIDVSGSMQAPDKLPLVKRALRLLVGELDAQDRVALVVYAGASGVVLEPTAGDRKGTIEAAIEALEAGGPTHGAAGVRLAYAKAREAFIPGGVNRVLLATDGDFNVGTVSHEALLELVEGERAAGIALTTLGFGTGNYNDRLLEQLADHGDGHYAYVDRLAEAQRVLVESLGGTLLTVAKDAKVQVEFNPAAVAEYRLIGYENRVLRREDFNNDRVDAGDVGAGHSVTALYELALAGRGGERIEPLRYGEPPAPVAGAEELAFVRVRYQRPGEAASRLLEAPLTGAAVRASLGEASADLRFAAAVAAFGQRLRGGTYLEGFGYDAIAALAREALGADPEGHRAEFLRLVRLAGVLEPPGPSAGPPAAGVTGRAGS
jgi:Ca-activated chloride channel family protein